MVGEDASRYCADSSFEAAFVGFASTGDLEDANIGFYMRDRGQLLLLELEDRMFMALAEASFAEDWDSEADSIYNNI